MSINNKTSIRNDSILSPSQLKYAINRSQQLISYALSTVLDYKDNHQVKNALTMVQTIDERLRLVEKLTQLRQAQQKKEEMERIDAIRPLLNKVKNKLHKLVDQSKAKSYGETQEDFEKIGVRKSKNRLNFISLLSITKNVNEERVEINEDIDKEYMQHRNRQREESMNLSSHQIHQRQARVGMSQFMRKLDESTNSNPQDNLLRTIPRLEKGVSKFKPSRTNLTYLTKGEERDLIPPVVLGQESLITSTTVQVRKRKIEFKREALPKISTVRRPPKDEFQRLFQLQKKRLMKPSSLHDYFSQRRQVHEFNE